MITKISISISLFLFAVHTNAMAGVPLRTGGVVIPCLETIKQVSPSEPDTTIDEWIAEALKNKTLFSKFETATKTQYGLTDLRAFPLAATDPIIERRWALVKALRYRVFHVRLDNHLSAQTDHQNHQIRLNGYAWEIFGPKNVRHPESPDLVLAHQIVDTLFYANNLNGDDFTNEAERFYSDLIEKHAAFKKAWNRQIPRRIRWGYSPLTWEHDLASQLFHFFREREGYREVFRALRHFRTQKTEFFSLTWAQFQKSKSALNDPQITEPDAETAFLKQEMKNNFPHLSPSLIDEFWDEPVPYAWLY